MLFVAMKNHLIFKIFIITLFLSFGSCFLYDDDTTCPSQFRESNFETGVFSYMICTKMSSKQFEFIYYFVRSLGGVTTSNSSCTTSNSTEPALNSTYPFCTRISISECPLQFRRIVLLVLVQDQTLTSCQFEMNAFPEKLPVVTKVFRTNTSMEIYAAIPSEELKSWESVSLTCESIDGKLCTDKFENCKEVNQDGVAAKLDLDPNTMYSDYYKCVGDLTTPDIYKFQLGLQTEDADVRVASPQIKLTNVSELMAVTCLEVMNIHQRELGRDEWVNNTQYADQLNLTIQFASTRYDYFVEYFCESDDIEVCGNKIAVLASDRIPTSGNDTNFSVQYRDVLLQTSPGAAYRMVVKAKVGPESVMAWRSAQIVSKPPKPHVQQKIMDGMVSSPGKPIYLTVTARSFEVSYLLLVYCNSSANGTCNAEPIERRVIEAVESVTNQAATWTQDIVIHLNFSTENMYNLEVKTESRGVFSDPWISPTYQGEATSKSITNISSETTAEKFSPESIDRISSTEVATSLKTTGVSEPGSGVSMVIQTSTEEVLEKETVERVDSFTSSTEANMSVITTSTLKVVEETSPAPATTDATTGERKFTVEAGTSAVTRTEQVTEDGTDKGQVKTRKKNKAIPFIIIGVIAVVGIAVGTAWYIRHRANKNKDVPDTSAGKIAEPPKEVKMKNISNPNDILLKDKQNIPESPA